MIWLAIAGALAVAFGTGGKPKSLLSEWLADWRKRLRKHVDDEARKQAGVEILDQAAKDLDVYFEGVQAQLLAMYEVHRSYESTLSDYEPAIDALGQLFGELEDRHVAALLAMRETLSSAEWSAIQAEIRAENMKELERQAKAERKAKAKAERKAEHDK